MLVVPCTGRQDEALQRAGLNLAIDADPDRSLCPAGGAGGALFNGFCVALLGITLALSTLVAERAHDIAALRAIGASPSQIAAIHLTEAGLIGLVSALLGMACGLLLSMILTWVVNKAFFGWTVRYDLPWSEWAATPLWVTAVALLAGCGGGGGGRRGGRRCHRFGSCQRSLPKEMLGPMCTWARGKAMAWAFAQAICAVF